jgi:hypothetical protein
MKYKEKRDSQNLARFDEFTARVLSVSNTTIKQKMAEEQREKDRKKPKKKP